MKDHNGNRKSTHRGPSSPHAKLTPEVIAGCAAAIPEIAARAAEILLDVCTSTVLRYCQIAGIRDDDIQNEIIQQVLCEAYCHARARPGEEPAKFQRKLFRFAEAYVDRLRKQRLTPRKQRRRRREDPEAGGRSAPASGNDPLPAVDPLERLFNAARIRFHEQGPETLVSNHEICNVVAQFWADALWRLRQTDPSNASFWDQLSLLPIALATVHSHEHWRQIGALRQAMYAVAQERAPQRQFEDGSEIHLLYTQLMRLSEPKEGDKLFLGFIRSLLEFLSNTCKQQT